RSGTRVRVSVTLVDASRDEQMWTQQYDNEVTPDNLFDIQSDIARQVVSELRAQLTPEDEDRLETLSPASDLAAQSWYYRGIDVYKNSSLDEIKASRDYLARAVAIDSTYTVAWSWLAQVESRLVFIGDGEIEPARVAMERTVALAPRSLEAHLARGFFAYYAQGDYDAARSAFEAAVRLAPSDADAAWALALILRRQGDWDESTTMMKRAAELDPRNSLRLETLAENLAWAGAFEDASAIVDRSLTLDPANARARSRKVEYLIEQDGGTERAHRMADELALDPTSFEEQTALTKMAFYDRRPDRVLEITAQVDRTGSPFLTLQLLIVRAQALALLDDPRIGAVVDSVLAIQNSSPGAEVDHPARIGFAEALAGRRDAALPDLREAERLAREWPDHVLNARWAFMTIAGYGAVGELDAGFGLLDDAVERPSEQLSVAALRLHPMFDPYREDPRFDEIIQRREAFEAKGARMGEVGRPWLP
ncbi:MAG: tetratricopeptide repeat protein, partial [Gemmatimonadales bacterium]